MRCNAANAERVSCPWPPRRSSARGSGSSFSAGVTWWCGPCWTRPFSRGSGTGWMAWCGSRGRRGRMIRAWTPPKHAGSPSSIRPTLAFPPSISIPCSPARRGSGWGIPGMCGVAAWRGCGDGSGWSGGGVGRRCRFLGEVAGEALYVEQVRVGDVVSGGGAAVGAAAKCGGGYQARGHAHDPLCAWRVDQDSARGDLLGEAADGGLVAGVDRGGVAGACDRKQPLASDNAGLFVGDSEEAQQGRELFLGVGIIPADITRRDDHELDRERSLDPSELGDE